MNMFELVALRSRLSKLEKQLEHEIVDNEDLEEACKIYEQIKLLNEMIRERKRWITVKYDCN